MSQSGTLFYDGTRLEVNVPFATALSGKSRCKKNEEELQEKMRLRLPVMAAKFGLHFHVSRKIKAKYLSLRGSQTGQGLVFFSPGLNKGVSHAFSKKHFATRPGNCFL